MKKIPSFLFLMTTLIFAAVLLFSAAGARQTATIQQPNMALTAIAGPDRVVVLPAKTYLNGWVGYGDPPRRERRRNEPPPQPPANPGPAPAIGWSMDSGPAAVT
ncbi:MAG: hypothetical protein NTU60_07820, partial [Candidatus Aminicenantes bacterium]|nr:hypothetical protein [Candidatus Aminicenantes bacterium]